MSAGSKSALYGQSTRRMLGMIGYESHSGGVVGVKILSYNGKRWVKVLVDGKVIECDKRYIYHRNTGKGFTHKELSYLKLHRHLPRINVLVEGDRVFLRNVDREVFPWRYEIIREAASNATDHNRHCDSEYEASTYFNLLKKKE